MTEINICVLVVCESVTMKRTFKLIDTPNSESNSDTDWDKCLFCQKETSEHLVCPSNPTNTRKLPVNAYDTIAANLLEFHKIKFLPDNLKLTRLDDGDGIRKTFQRRGATYHTSCSLRYNKTELIRSTKRVLNERQSTSEEDSSSSKRFTRSNVSTSDKSQCFFCNEPEKKGQSLTKAATIAIDNNVRQCAINLQDQLLLSKLSEGDMVAIDAVYHKPCLVALYNRNRLYLQKSEGKDVKKSAHTSAFAELISYIESNIDNEEVVTVFKLSHLKLGDEPSYVHSTRLKEKILNYFPELEAHSEGRGILLVEQKDVGPSLRAACAIDAEFEAVTLSRAANIIRRDILKFRDVSFEGSFETGCQENSVPASLMTLIGLILGGTDIRNETNYKSQKCLSISQLLLFNFECDRRRGGTGTADTSAVKHSNKRETPLPLLLGSFIHSKTRSKELVDTMYRLGLSVSYDRVLSLSGDLGNANIKHFHDVGSVCPPQLKIGIFTTSAVDNLDHNPTSTSALGSFHGTSISLFQHPDNCEQGRKQELNKTPFDRSKKLHKLPTNYTRPRQYPPLERK